MLNSAFLKAFGIEREDLIGKTVIDLERNPIELRRELQQEAEELVRTGGMIHKETCRRYADGNVHDLLYWETAFKLSDGSVGGLVGNHIDITELKELERELEIANKRMGDELNIGRQIQMSMIPLKFPPFPDHDEFSIFAALEPAREVGGDFYDFYFLDEERLCVSIGDVSGKGVPAALFMAMAKTLIKSRAYDDRSTASILTHVNAELSTNNANSMFVTIFVAVININTGELLFTNAGHDPPYIKRRDGTLQRLDQRHGPVIGALEGMVYKEDKDIMAPGDLLIVFTDGVTEAMDVEDQLFSEARYTEVLGRTKADDPESIVGITLAAIEKFTGGAEQSDDITILALQFHGASEDRLMAEQQIVIKNQLSEMIVVNEKFESFAEEFDIPQSVALKFKVVFDELLGNIISYAYTDDDEHDIEVRMERVGKRLIVTITDDGVPFNPLSEKKPDTDLSLEDREIGGLGIHLVRNLVDNVSYQRRIGKNVMTIMRYLEQNGGAP
jgi:sigma-B regulation protein RsbU (phosphoserine phosphatase)